MSGWQLTCWKGEKPDFRVADISLRSSVSYQTLSGQIRKESYNCSTGDSTDKSKNNLQEHDKVVYNILIVYFILSTPTNLINSLPYSFGCISRIFLDTGVNECQQSVARLQNQINESLFTESKKTYSTIWFRTLF